MQIGEETSLSKLFAALARVDRTFTLDGSPEGTITLTYSDGLQLRSNIWR